MSRTEKIRRGTKSVFWGVLLLLGAVAMVVGRLGYLDGIGVWNILFSVFLVGFLINGFVNRSFGEILFSLAFLVIVNDKLFNLEAITPWPVLGAALLGTIGLDLLFPRFQKGERYVNMHVHTEGKERDGMESVSEEERNGDSVSYVNVFTGSVKYLYGGISHVRAENVFGTLQIYFTDAVLKGGTATLVAENVFGTTVLYVPASWRVVLSTENVFGGTREQGHCDPAGTTVLYIKGEVVFGNMQIKYV